MRRVPCFTYKAETRPGTCVPCENAKDPGQPPRVIECNPCFKEAFEQCPNSAKPMVKCPPGNRAFRARPIYPRPQMLPEMQQKSSWITSYKFDFSQKLVDRPGLMKPASNPYRPVPYIALESTYQHEYTPHKVQCSQRPKWLKDKDYEPNPYPFKARSMYSADYQPKYGCPAKSAKRKFVLDPNPPKMKYCSSYKATFVKHPGVPCVPKKSQKDKAEDASVNCIPFQGVTTYQRDYMPVRGCPSLIVKRNKNAWRTEGPFDDKTVYRCSYEPYYFDDTGEWKDCVQDEVYRNVMSCPR